MLRIAVCDDETKILGDLSQKISEAFLRTSSKPEIYKTDNPIELLEYLSSNSIDILFLDIDMPKISGMDIAQSLLDNDMKTILIFVTNHDALVYKSFKYHPFGFIRKSCLDDEIGAVVSSAIEEICKRRDTFSFKTNEGFYKVRISDILYFESDSNYLNLHSAERIYRIRATLSSVENELSQKGFIRTHKGFLVNQQHIYSIRSDDIVLSNEELLPIGRTNREGIKQKIMRYMR